MYESFTLGWLNLLVQHLWVPVLEKFVSTLAAERLQVILNEVGASPRARFHRAARMTAELRVRIRRHV